MDSESGSLRKSKRTPVPKKSFDLIEGYEAPPLLPTPSKAAPAAPSAKSEEKKKLLKTPTSAKGGRKRLSSSKQEHATEQEQEAVDAPSVIEHQIADITPAKKTPGRKRGRKPKRDKQINEVNTQVVINQDITTSNDTTMPITTAKNDEDNTVKSVNSLDTCEKNQTVHVHAEVSKGTKTKSKRKRKYIEETKPEEVTTTSKSGRYPSVETVVVKLETPDETDQGVMTADAVECTPQLHVEAQASVDKNVLKQDLVAYKNPVESDVFMNSCDMTPAKKKSRKEPRKRLLSATEGCVPRSDTDDTSTSIDQLASNLLSNVKSKSVQIKSKVKEKRSCKVTEKADGHLVIKMEDITNKGCRDDSSHDNSAFLGEGTSRDDLFGNAADVVNADTEVSLELLEADQRKVAASGKVVWETDKGSHETLQERNPEALGESNDEEGTAANSNGEMPETDFALPYEPSLLKMRKRKVYKRKHGERVLVRIVTELHSETGELISSSVEDVKGKHSDTKKGKTKKHSSEKKGARGKTPTKKARKSLSKKQKKPKNAASAQDDPLSELDDDMMVLPDKLVRSLSKRKQLEATGGKEFKKMQTLTAYILYCRKHRKRVVQEHPTYDFSQISKTLGEMWNSTPEEEKAVYRVQLEEHKAKVNSALRKMKLKTAGLTENDGMSKSLKSSLLKSHSKDDVDIPAYSTVNLEPIDFASHLVLLGESLTMISSALFQQDQQTVHGSLSVLLDSAVCAIAPLLFLTGSVPQMDAIPDDLKAQVLDNVSFILPGV